MNKQLSSLVQTKQLHLQISNKDQESMSLSKRVQQRVMSKYQTEFNIFLTIPINFIMYQYTKAKDNIDYKDCLFWVADRQFMIYMCGYANIDQNPRPEKVKSTLSFIIKYLCQSPKASKRVSFEYPTMILTKNYKIFMQRFRRKKCGRAVNQSSSSSQSNSRIISGLSQLRQKYMYETPKSISNKYLYSSSSQSEDDADYASSWSQNLSISFSETVYNMFPSPCPSLIDESQEKLRLNQINEGMVEKYICDFTLLNQGFQSKKQQRCQNDIHEKIQKGVISYKSKRPYPEEERLKKIHEQQQKLIMAMNAQENISKKQKKKQKNLKSPFKKTVHEKAILLLEKVKKQQSTASNTNNQFISKE